MIYLIGGAPRVGKSLLANKLGQILGIQPISTDTICSAYTKTLDLDLKRVQFPLPGFSGDPTENTLPPEERARLQAVSATSLQPEIRRVLKEATAEGTSLILEGVHLLPSFAQVLIQEYGETRLQAVFIGSENVDAIVGGIMQNTNPDNWLRESNPQVIRQVAEAAAAFSAFVRKQAQETGLPYYERTERFTEDLETATNSLLPNALEEQRIH